MDDDRSTADDLVDTLLVNHNLPVGKESVRMNYTGIYRFLTMDLTLRAVCAENFAGTDCSQCLPGFTGAQCDIQIGSEDFISYSSNPSTSTSTHQPVPKGNSGKTVVSDSRYNIIMQIYKQKMFL